MTPALPVANAAPRTLAQVPAEPGEPHAFARGVNIGLVIVGVSLSAIAYSHREKGWGFVLGNISASMAAIGGAFLFLDIVGGRVPEGREI